MERMNNRPPGRMYLWSNPDLPHWQRLLLGLPYLALLFWWWLVGNPICLYCRSKQAEEFHPEDIYVIE